MVAIANAVELDVVDTPGVVDDEVVVDEDPDSDMDVDVSFGIEDE